MGGLRETPVGGLGETLNETEVVYINYMYMYLYYITPNSLAGSSINCE